MLERKIMKKARLEDASDRVKKLIDLKDRINNIDFENDGLKQHVEAICGQIHKDLTELQRFCQAVDIELFHKSSESDVEVTRNVLQK
jgi:hypothetical protein